MTHRIKPGQIWADNDKRAEGRTIRVDHIEDGKAICTVLTNRTAAQHQIDHGSPWVTDMRGKTTRISLNRFRPTNTGYRLIQETQ